MVLAVELGERLLAGRICCTKMSRRQRCADDGLEALRRLLAAPRGSRADRLKAGGATSRLGRRSVLADAAERHRLDGGRRGLRGQSRKVRTAPSARTWRTASSARPRRAPSPAASSLPLGDHPVLGEADVGRRVDRRRAGGCGWRPTASRRCRRSPPGPPRTGSRAPAPCAPVRTRAVAAQRVGRARHQQDLGAGLGHGAREAAGTRRRSRSGCRSARARCRRPAPRLPAAMPQASRSKRLGISLSCVAAAAVRGEEPRPVDRRRPSRGRSGAGGGADVELELAGEAARAGRRRP